MCPDSPAAKALVEAALLFVQRHTDGRRCSIELDPDNCGSSEQLIKAAKAWTRAAKRGRK